jgi:hypothetical protein
MSDDLTPEARAAISEWTQVPEGMLSSAQTLDEAWQLATLARDWKQATAPPATSGIPAPAPTPAAAPTPILRQSLVDSDDWLTAWRQNRLGPMGAPAPPPRKNGEAHRNNGP